MQTEADKFENIIERLREMSSADRKAVLVRLGVEQRLAIEQALSGRKAQADPEQGPSPSQWHRLFSPVLARMLAEIDREEPAKGGTGKPLTPATRVALAECASTYAEDQSRTKAGQAGSFLDLLGKLIAPSRAK